MLLLVAYPPLFPVLLDCYYFVLLNAVSLIFVFLPLDVFFVEFFADYTIAGCSSIKISFDKNRLTDWCPPCFPTSISYPS